MSDPIVHFKLWNDLGKEIYEDIVGFGLIEEFSLIYLLNVEVLIDWDLN